ncbi:MAG: polyribonucleotide nucleotidyltransferase [Myxococcales bacterium]|nr:polyribonucleotide nucleotidyltransferase [Myxococcales bacterium]
MPMKKSVRLGESEFTLDVGRVARQADGSCLVRFGDTMVLVAAVAAAKPREGVDFLPLTVDYREKASAAGKIPGGFFKREGRPTETEILNSRIIDRSIRPLFPKGFAHETQVQALVLSADPQNAPDVLAATGASLALCLSDVPFAGPLATVRVGRIDGQWRVNPSFKQVEASDVNLVVSATREAICMVEGEAREVSEKDLVDALMFAYEQAQGLIRIQDELIQALGKPKRTFTPHAIDPRVAAWTREQVGGRLGQLMSIPVKLDRYHFMEAIRLDLQERVVQAFPDVEHATLDVFETLEKMHRDLVRGAIAREGRRLDGRGLTNVRPITCEVGVLPRTHGSALFTRGETQALVTTTLGTTQDEQLIENLEAEFTKKFMLHYNFPPFSVGEVRPIRGPGRREIGHGALAERSIKSMLPNHQDFPYTIRVVSDILESNGSSSMATVCGASLSLMDAGVKLHKPVAGVAMGLIKEESGFHVLTDIMGDEDHLGDMDFKVAGSRDGITGIQMDIKVTGIDRAVLERALAQAREARLHILREMEKTLAAPRPDLSPYAPRITTIQIKPERIKDVIGPGGRVIKDLVARTGCSIDVEDDGTVRVGSSDPEMAKEAIRIIRELTQEAEIGKLYMATVRKITDFGAFCEILPGTDGLLHISELSDKRVEKVSDVLREGDEVLVKVVSIDRQGKIRLSRKEALNQKPE